MEQITEPKEMLTGKIEKAFDFVPGDYVDLTDISWIDGISVFFCFNVD